MSSPYDESILRSLRRITRSIDVHSRSLASTYRLTAPQLVCLRELSHHGSMAPSKIAERVSLSQATVTGILDRLEAKNLVVRTRQTHDKRRVVVELTQEGGDLAAMAPVPLHQRFAERLAKLSEQEQARIDQVLRQIVGMMEASDLDAAPVLGAGHVATDEGAVEEFLTSTDADASET